MFVVSVWVCLSSAVKLIPSQAHTRESKRCLYFDDFEAGAKGAMVTLTWVRNFDMEAAEDMAGYV